MAKYEKWLESDNLLLLEAWARDGLTEEQIALKAHIASSTLREWKNKYSAISAALKRGKEVVDIEIENILKKKALGFTQIIAKPVKLKTVYYNNGKREKEEEIIQMVEEEIYIPPSEVAQIFWLKNRKPEQWREKQSIEISKTTSEIVDEIEKYVTSNDKPTT